MKALKLVGLLLCALVAACAATPEAPRDVDAEAKQFNTHPNAATIYVYRSYYTETAEQSVLYVDSRLVGQTLPGSYFRIDAVPGRHVLHGIGVDAGYLTLDARPGELYFVRLDVYAGHSHFRVEPEQLARAEIRACCAMLENWTPGQRPFLR